MDTYNNLIPDLKNIVDGFTGEKYYYNECVKELKTEYDTIIFKFNNEVYIRNAWDVKDVCLFELRCLHL